MREEDLVTIDEAFRVAKTWSDNPDTPTAALLVRGDYSLVVWEANGVPTGINPNADRLLHAYKWFMHAACRAVAKAARLGVKTQGLTSVLTTPPCAGCAQALVEAGITVVIYPADHGGWTKSIQDGHDILHAGGVNVREVSR
jgi:deoxycytidylate deaminase